MSICRPCMCAACIRMGFLWYAHAIHLNMYTYHPSADVWVEGELPPGWREISDSSEVYFWHVPTGTTQYDRPVASCNQHTSSEADTDHDQQNETQESLKLPNEVRWIIDWTHIRMVFIAEPRHDQWHVHMHFWCFTQRLVHIFSHVARFCRIFKTEDDKERC